MSSEATATLAAASASSVVSRAASTAPSPGLFGPALALLLVNVALQVVDGGATLVGVGRGFPEGNPLLDHAIATLGLPAAVVVAKAVAVVLLLLLYRSRTHPWVIPGLAGVAIAYITFAVLPWTLVLLSLPG